MIRIQMYSKNSHQKLPGPILQEISVHLYSVKYDPDDGTYLQDLLPGTEALPKKCRKVSS